MLAAEQVLSRSICSSICPSVLFFFYPVSFFHCSSLFRWFKKAADQGHAEAQFHLGTMYFAGLGVDKKYTTALQYFTLAGHAGHTRSLYNLGMMHLHGLGTIKSCAIGVKLHKSVAERGHWAAVLNEAHRNFLKGRYEIAWLQYARAAEEGFEVAQANSAWMLDQGLVGSLVDGTDAPAIGMSADAQETTPAPRVSRRHLLAHRHWSMAAAQGNIDSLRVLGDYAFDGLVTGTPDYAAAIKFYSEAAEHRNAQAMFNLGSVNSGENRGSRGAGAGAAGGERRTRRHVYRSPDNRCAPFPLAASASGRGGKTRALFTWRSVAGTHAWPAKRASRR